MENNLEIEAYEKNRKTMKMFLMFGMISIVMIFAGLTSAFVVSKSRPDWLKDLVLPVSFTISTITLIASSMSMYFAEKSIKKNNHSATKMYLLITFALGILFFYFQFKGFNDLFDRGLVPTGASGKVTVSFLYAFAIVHILHLVGGVISLLVVIYNHFKQKYNSAQHLGLELSGMYWHFMDFVWIYLFLFFTFFK
jgi:cytochrome c oxidase subunit III